VIKKSKRGYALTDTIIAAALTVFIIYGAVTVQSYINSNTKLANEAAAKAEDYNMVYGFLLRDASAATELASLENGFAFFNGAYSVTYTITENNEILRQGEKLCKLDGVSYYATGDYLDIGLNIFEYGTKKVRIYTGGAG